MELIDAQVHVVAPDTPERPWSADYGLLAGNDDEARRKFRAIGSGEVDDTSMLAAMDETGVTGALILTTSHYGWNNDYGVEVALQNPTRFRVIGRLDHSRPDIWDAVEHWSRGPVNAGLRVLLASPLHVRQWEDGAFDALLSACEAFRAPVCIYSPSDPAAICAKIRAYGEINWVIDHLGLPQPPHFDRPPDIRQALEPVLRLADLPNVAVKVSGAPSLSQEVFPFYDVLALIQLLADRFGIDRLLWGSDWTRVAKLYDYPSSIEYLKQSSAFSADEKRRLFGANSRRVFRWV